MYEYGRLMLTSILSILQISMSINNLAVGYVVVMVYTITNDSSVKMPIVMKDMLMKLVEESPTPLNELHMLGYVIMGALQLIICYFFFLYGY